MTNIDRPPGVGVLSSLEGAPPKAVWPWVAQIGQRDYTDDWKARLAEITAVAEWRKDSKSVAGAVCEPQALPHLG